MSQVSEAGLVSLKYNAMLGPTVLLVLRLILGGKAGLLCGLSVHKDKGLVKKFHEGYNRYQWCHYTSLDSSLMSLEDSWLAFQTFQKIVILR